MEIECGILNILFRHISYADITLTEISGFKQNDCFHINKQSFLEKCNLVFPDYSEDEWCNIYSFMDGIVGTSSIFKLVVNFCGNLLSYHSGEVLCKFEQLLRWREISLALGQDALICCYLADYDVRNNILRKNFSWLPIIMSDNNRINAIMQRGIADNHFHLKGSARIFETNWIYLMNNICGNDWQFYQLKCSLSYPTTDGKDFSKEFYKECKLAALYRIYLFYVLSNENTDFLRRIIEKSSSFLDVYISDVQAQINNAKFLYGTAIHNGVVLDYALSKDIILYSGKQYSVLLGERNFLYKCYRACILNEFDRYTKNIFYRYLNIQIAFRSELIQVNKNIGFKNFSNYEKRKCCFLHKNNIYIDEYIKTAIVYQIKRNNLQSLEMRMTPSVKAQDTFLQLQNYENIIKKNADMSNINNIKYVMHFPKVSDDISTLKFIGNLCTCERNEVIRRYSKKRALSLVKLMTQVPHLAQRIVGIDACSSELGCRPEVFGQLYRYLQRKNFEFKDCNDVLKSIECCSKTLNLTYHVGEDFFDIADGLRALDELLLFCNLTRGCRIGHALALGIEPVDYYKSKNNLVLLKKQDLLDNVVWILCKSEEFGCKIEPKLKLELEQKFIELLYDLLPEQGNMLLTGITVLQYYQSWKLRGDNPKLYKYSYTNFKRQIKMRHKMFSDWDKCNFNDNESVPETIRNCELYYELTHNYFYGKKTRQRGEEITKFKIKESYIHLMREIQDNMIKVLVERGIAIETNPSSNYMIGTIRRYDQHPIIRFNSRNLKKMPLGMSLSVSINTDDQGVFDTLLENEYALMALALEKAKDDAGNRMYDIEDIYEWLDYVRRMGLEQSFNVRYMLQKERVDYE